MKTEVVNRPDDKRYEIRADGELAGFVDYILTSDMITFTHTNATPSVRQRMA